VDAAHEFSLFFKKIPKIEIIGPLDYISSEIAGNFTL
jgi:hypothetical protein